MSHQDQTHVAPNVAEIQAALAKIIPASIVEYRRHGNATLSAQTLVSVALDRKEGVRSHCFAEMANQ